MADADKNQYLHEGSNWLYSLNKFVGMRIADVLGYPSQPFGTTEPVFVVSQIVFEDGSTIRVGSEHDVAFLASSADLKNMDEGTLQKFMNAS